jgi:FAD/FMN-containing dehydrogenase
MNTDLLSRVEAVRSRLDPALMVEAGNWPRYCNDCTGDYQGRPALVMRPRSTQEVVEIVRACRAANLPIVPQGGHTGLVGGATPSAAENEVIISLERMNKIRNIDELNFSMTVEAGCVLEAVHEAALVHDRMFPLSLGAKGSCQIGGNIATNAGGVNVLRYGMMRDLLLGVEMVLANGQIWNGLHGLRKNNIGYDVQQLFLGSEGTLGVITAAVLKLFPKPTKTITAFLAVESVAHALAIYSLARSELSDLVSAFELLPRVGIDLAMKTVPTLRDPLSAPSPYYVLLEATGSGRVDLQTMAEGFLSALMDRSLVSDGALAASNSHAAAFWGLREAMVEAEFRFGRHLRTDVSVPISSIPRFMADTGALLGKRAPAAVLLPYGHVGDGNIHYDVLPPRDLGGEELITYLTNCEEWILGVVDGLGGSLSAEHGIGHSKRDAFAARVSPVHLDMMRVIKTAFDPDNLLSPGRILA